MDERKDLRTVVGTKIWRFLFLFVVLSLILYDNHWLLLNTQVFLPFVSF